MSEFEGDRNPYVKINTANVKNNQFTTTVELADCTDPSCPTITASQLTGGLYGPGAAESGGTFVAEGISFAGDDYGPEESSDFTLISLWVGENSSKTFVGTSATEFNCGSSRV